MDKQTNTSGFDDGYNGVDKHLVYEVSRYTVKILYLYLSPVSSDSTENVTISIFGLSAVLPGSGQFSLHGE